MYQITSMLALPFVWTSAGSGADGRVRLTGGTWRAMTLASGTYRMLLGTSAGTVRDFVRMVGAAINAALVPDGKLVTCALNVDSGRLTIITTTAGAIDLELPTLADRLLGSVNASNQESFTATYQPMYAAFTCSAYGPQREMLSAGGWETTAGGRTYGTRACAPSWRWRRKVRFLPKTPTLRTGVTDATAAYPDDAYLSSLGSTATARAWSWLDCLYVAGNDASGVPIAWCQSDYLGMAGGSTSLSYHLGYLDAEMMGEVAPVPQDESWPLWQHLDLVLRLPSVDSTGTRA